jgi:hypothetical protein
MAHLPVLAVQKIRPAAERVQKSKSGGSETIKLGGSRTENKSKGGGSTDDRPTETLNLNFGKW